jgi:hypothetical protein
MDKKNFSEKTVFSIYSPEDLSKRWFLSYYDNDGSRQRVYGTINAGKTFQERMAAADALKKKYEKASMGIKMRSWSTCSIKTSEKRAFKPQNLRWICFSGFCLAAE